MEYHPRFRGANLFLGQFRAALQDAVKENKYPSRVSEIEDSQLVLPLLRAQLSQLSRTCEEYGKGSLGPSCSNNLINARALARCCSGRLLRYSSTGAWPRSSAKKSTCQAIPYRISLIRYACKQRTWPRLNSKNRHWVLHPCGFQGAFVDLVFLLRDGTSLRGRPIRGLSVWGF